jgi:hypothetical protein
MFNAIDVTHLITFRAYKYLELQVTITFGKLNCKVSCKIPNENHSEKAQTL